MQQLPVKQKNMYMYENSLNNQTKFVLIEDNLFNLEQIASVHFNDIVQPQLAVVTQKNGKVTTFNLGGANQHLARFIAAVQHFPRSGVFRVCKVPMFNFWACQYKTEGGFWVNISTDVRSEFPVPRQVINFASYEYGNKNPYVNDVREHWILSKNGACYHSKKNSGFCKDAWDCGAISASCSADGGAFICM